MIREFAAAKVNLALHVLGRRGDGYHDLDSIVAFADVGDWLTVEAASPRPSPGRLQDDFQITVSGRFAADVPPSADNIITRAAAALAEAGFAVPPLKVNLEKNLPVASGIGGGSADAAAMLRACLRLLGRAPSPEIMSRIALSLGADVPVCLNGKACRMQGVGERITPLASFAPLHAVLVNPHVAVATPEIFARLGLARGQRFRGAVAGQESWRNDMTQAAVALAPAIGEVLATLQMQQGLHAARMSGSGATCFGLFDSAPTSQRACDVIAAAHPDWWVVTTILS